MLLWLPHLLLGSVTVDIPKVGLKLLGASPPKKMTNRRSEG